jgi:hypothetical protein
LVIEVGAHVVGNRNDEGAQILEMTIERGCLFKVLEFDHVSIVAV